MESPVTPFTVTVESQTVCCVDGLVRSVAVMMSLFFIFDLAYPKNRKNTLLFIQKWLLDLEDKTKTPPKVVTLMKKISDYNLRSN